MAQVTLPEKPLCVVHGKGQLVASHALTVGLEAVTLSTVSLTGLHELTGFYIGARGFSAMPVGKSGTFVILDDPKWIARFINRMGIQSEFTAAELVSFLSTQTRRSLLTSHLLVAFENEPDSLAPLKLEEDVIATTVRQYTNLLEWTESSAAAVLALQNGVSVATIHNRLRIAREKGILEKPGSGKRTL